MPKDNLQNQTNNFTPSPSAGPNIPSVNSQSLQPDNNPIKENVQEPEKSATVSVPPFIVASGLSQNSTKPLKKSRNKLVITALGVLLLAGGIGAGVFLSQQPQEIREKAQTTGLSTDLPTLPPANDNKTESAGCNSIKIYKITGDPQVSSSWIQLTNEEIAKLKAGDIVYFVAQGFETSGVSSIDAAKIKVNDEEKDASIKPSDQLCAGIVDQACPVEFYIEYKIPSEINTFSISAKFHSQEDDTWF